MHWPKPFCFHSKLINAHIDRVCIELSMKNQTAKCNQKIQNNNKKKKKLLIMTIVVIRPK